MKINKINTVFSLLLAFIFVSGVFVSAASAQQATRPAANTRTLPNGVRPISDTDNTTFMRDAKAKVKSLVTANSDKAATNNGVGSPCSPMFVIESAGNIHTGLSVVGRNHCEIPEGSYTAGFRVTTSNNVESLNGYYATLPTQAGSWWYEFENGSKPSSMQAGGVAAYYMVVQLPDNGGMIISYLQLDVRNYAHLSDARKMITGGITGHLDNGGGVFLLYGNFHFGYVGVTVQAVANDYEMLLPTNSVFAFGGMVFISTDNIPYFWGGPGDYIITITDGSGLSDSFPLRLNRPQQDRPADLLEIQRVQALLAKNSK